MAQPEPAEARRQQVLKAARTAGPAATRELIAALVDEDPLVREWAILGLPRRKDRAEAVPDLLRRLRDSRADVRWYAARALGKLGVVTPEVRDALVDALRDRDEFVRSFAAWALGVLQFKDAIPALRERLLEQSRRRGLEDQSIGIALARLNTPKVVEEQQQGSLFGDEIGGETLPSGLPKTKGDMLREELLKTAERVAIDRAGGAIVVRGTLRLSMQYARSVALKERVLAQRGRRCQLCGFTFRKADGEEYAECHHLKAVSQGGPDHADNLLVVCPNHHKQLHLAAVVFTVGTSCPAELSINGETIAVRWST